MNWYDGLTDFEAYLKSMDMYDRIDSEIDLVLSEEFKEENHNDRQS